MNFRFRVFAAFLALIILVVPVSVSADGDTPSQSLPVYVDLAYDEYASAVTNGQIVNAEAYQEALDYIQAARAAFGQASNLSAADQTRLDTLLTTIQSAITNLESPDQVHESVQEALTLLAVPRATADADVAVTVSNLKDMLGQVETQARAGQYADAENTRLQAYALFEGTLEARLKSREPSLAHDIEALFWDGSETNPGLAALIDRQSPVAEVASAVNALKGELSTVSQILSGGLSDTMAIVNSAGIIVREGLEAVLILGAILGCLRATNGKKSYALWVYGGIVAAVLLTLATWWVTQSLITISAGNRELIGGITSLIAVGILFYVTNWLFHKMYVVDWLTFVKEQVGKALVGGSVFALAGLGFSVVYREGLETVLFYQALVFDAHPAAVFGGFLIGIVAILIIAYLVLYMSKRLPLKPFFTVTAVLLLVMAFSFTGAGVHELQEAGVISLSSVSFIPSGGILTDVFGIYPTLETLLAQALFLSGIVVTFGYSRWQGRRAAVPAASS